MSEHKNNEVVTMGLAQEVERLRNGQELLREQTVRIREALGNAGNGEDTEDAAKRLRAERDVLKGESETLLTNYALKLKRDKSAINLGVAASERKAQLYSMKLHR